MKTVTIRSAVALAELVAGLASIAAGSWFLYQNLDCPPEIGGECTAWGLFGALLFLLPGVFVALAGALSYCWTGVPLKRIQLVLVATLFAYFVFLFADL